ncbi:MAG: hypothetical protein ACYCSR_05700 [Thiomonas sp.]
MSPYTPRFVKSLLAAVFIISLAACGGGGGTAGTPLLGAGSTASSGGLGASKPTANLAYQISLTPAALNVATNSVYQLKAVVTANGSAASNTKVTFTIGSASSGPTLNGSTSAVTVTTGTDGSAYVRYQAGQQAGTDVIVASVGTANVNEVSQSTSISVTTSAPSGWTLNLSGVPTQGTCSIGTNVNGSSLFCGPLSANTVDPISGLQYVGYGTRLAAFVVDSNNKPVIGASVSFTMGSTTTSATVGYCNTSTGAPTTGPTCTDHATNNPGKPSTALVQAGVLNNQNNVTTTVAATTNTNGIAYVNYASGGQGGYDVVNVTVSYPTSSGGLAQATQSVTMYVQ